jgi:hypothetical protein
VDWCLVKYRGDSTLYMCVCMRMFVCITLTTVDLKKAQYVVNAKKR